VAGQVLAGAAWEGPEQIVMDLISNGVPLGELTTAEYWPVGNRGALQNACAKSRMALVRALLAAGAPSAPLSDVELAECLGKAKP
jgi:hypothetical protein